VGYFGPRKITIGAKLWVPSDSEINCVGARTVIAPIENCFWTIFQALSRAIPLNPRTMPDTGSASGESSQPSEGRDYAMRRRIEPAPDEGGLTDSISLILKELRLMKNEMASNKTEFEEKLAMITQNIRSAADQDTAFSVKTASKETVERMDGRATEAQPKAGTPETGGNGDSPGGNGDEYLHFQMAAETIQERVEVGGIRQHFATLRPEAPNMVTGKPVKLEDWLEAVHIYLAL
jgi:hypothetical protein